MKRAGLNGTLVYAYLNKVYAYRVRVFGYTSSYQMVASEGENARMSRAYYPHRVTIDRFSITVQLKGYSEWRDFNVWMTDYAKNLNAATMLNNAPTPVMTVVLAGRSWFRIGVPVSGFGFGDHLGAILWQPVIVFEAANDPYEKNPNAVTYSTYNDTTAVLADKSHTASYFYPFSQFANGTTDSAFYDQAKEANTTSSGYVDNSSVTQTIGNANSTPNPSAGSNPGDATTDAGSDPSYGVPPTDAASSSWGG